MSQQQIRTSLLRTTTLSLTSLALLETTTHLPTQGRSSPAYHSLFDSILTPLGRLLPPESAHDWSVEVVRRGWAPRVVDAKSMRVRVGRVEFESPIGLAAGFDKNGVAIGGLFDLGFSFVEVGSVTPLPQPGNPKPRSFRLIEDRGIINRFGFNSEGAEVVRRHLREYRVQFGGRGAGLEEKFDSDTVEEVVEASQTTGTVDGTMENDGTDEKRSSKGIDNVWHVSTLIGNSLFRTLGWVYARTLETHHRTGVVGVNLGKNKTSEDEVGDYTHGIRQLGPYADYLVINVSSPNTPGLRSLQNPEPLRNLLLASLQARTLFAPHAPLFVKLAPDLSDEEMGEIAKVVVDTGVDGVIVGNTTNARPEWLLSERRHEVGGLSGAPLKERSTECIRTMYRLTNGEVPIIGVGGVGSGRDVYDKLKAGASLVQVYSMMVYEGPGLIGRIRRELADIIVENGHRSVEEVVGLDCEDIYWRKREESVLRKMKEVEKGFIEL